MAKDYLAKRSWNANTLAWSPIAALLFGDTLQRGLGYDYDLDARFKDAFSSRFRARISDGSA